MKLVFNCSDINSVKLIEPTIASAKVISLEIIFFNRKDFLYIKDVSKVSCEDYWIEKVRTAYNDIKNALQSNNKFVEIEL
jgi:hypothetical protein